MSGWMGVCEHCNRKKQEGELLSFLDFWAIVNNRKWHSYHIVCDSCLETRQEWCNEVFPDYCELCGALIVEKGDHCLEKKFNRQGQEIQFYGLEMDEPCKIICEDCFKKINGVKN